MNELITPHGAIRYSITGHGSALVFLHSVLAGHQQWGVPVEALSREHCCITYDLLRYGSSDNVPEKYDPADTLLALLDPLGVATTTLVGSSLAGRWRFMPLSGTHIASGRWSWRVPDALGFSPRSMTPSLRSTRSMKRHWRLTTLADSSISNGAHPPGSCQSSWPPCGYSRIVRPSPHHLLPLSDAL